MVDHNFHQFTGVKTLGDLAERSNCAVHDKDESFEVHDVAPLSQATKTEISFFDNIKYKQDLINTKAGAVIVSERMREFVPETCKALISKTPYKSYALVAQAFYPDVYPKADVSSHAFVDETATIGEGSVIEAGAVIHAGAKIGKGSWIESNAVVGRNVEIGDKSRIGSNASITHTIMGQGSRVYPGARIGQDGFGFAIDPAGHVKVPQLGRVLIGDNVEIGANTCIDRGAGPDTVIGDSVWIDNCVQIGHNVKIGRGCVIIAHVGIAGSATLEDYVVVAGQVGIAGHITIGQGSRIAAQSGVIKDLPPGSEVMGSPSLPIKDHLRQIAHLKKLTKEKKSG